MSVKIFRTAVTLNTFLSMRRSATTPDSVENNQAPRYGKAERKPFWTERERDEVIHSAKDDCSLSNFRRDTLTQLAVQ